MFIQIFRNKISESQEFLRKTKDIDAIIRNQYGQREQKIITAIANEWSKKQVINLPSFSLNYINYELELRFTKQLSHGKPYVCIMDQNDLNFKTELGDILIVVEYILEGSPLARKVSILQTKKETQANRTQIPLHQLYLMQYWPSLFFGKPFKFENVFPEEFSFYHFVLNKSNHPSYSSTVSSAPFVGAQIGRNKSRLEGELRNWLKNKTALPSASLKGLLPSCFRTCYKPYVHPSDSWRMVPKPFGRFLIDAAYLFLGTENDKIYELAERRIHTRLLLQVVARRLNNTDHSDIESRSPT